MVSHEGDKLAGVASSIREPGQIYVDNRIGLASWTEYDTWRASQHRQRLKFGEPAPGSAFSQALMHF